MKKALILALLLAVTFLAHAQQTAATAADDTTAPRSTTPYAHAYFLTPSAFQLPTGSFEYSNRYLFFNNVTYGISDNVSLNAGIEIASLVNVPFSGNYTPFYWIGGKISTQVSSKMRIGLSETTFIHPSYYVPFDEETRDDFGNRINTYRALNFLHGLITYGDSRKNITFGVGIAESRGKVSKPLLTVSGIYPISNRVSFIFEGYFSKDYTDVPESFQNSLLGIRLAGKKHVFDLGVGVSYEKGVTPIPYPYIGYRKRF
jgi:hypothetical protein